MLCTECRQVFPPNARSRVQGHCYRNYRWLFQSAMGDQPTGAVFQMTSTKDTWTAYRIRPIRAQVSTFTTRVLVRAEGRTARPADNDRFTFQYKTNTRKGGLMESGRSVLRQQAGFQFRPSFRGRQLSGTVRLRFIQGAFPFFQ